MRDADELNPDIAAPGGPVTAADVRRIFEEESAPDMRKYIAKATANCDAVDRTMEQQQRLWAELKRYGEGLQKLVKETKRLHAEAAARNRKISEKIDQHMALLRASGLAERIQ